MENNVVLEGKYKGKWIATSSTSILISIGIFKNVLVNKMTVKNYEVLTEEHYKSAASGISRGF
ncbi:MAG: hypothetical protein ACYCWE_20650 [Eubacteriales bacterium]